MVPVIKSLQFAYNANHELTKSLTITQQGLDLTETTTTYQYDAFGRRISKHTQTKNKTRRVNRQSTKIIKFPVQQQKTENSKVHYLWDGNRQLQEQTDTHIFTTIYEQDSFEPVARLVWLQDGVQIAANEPEYRSVWDDKPKPKSDIQIYHCHNDHLGTPNELTTHDGEVVWLADYEAYGNTAKIVWREEKLESVQVAKQHLQPIRFQGQYYDEETGLHYNRFRYFDPDLGMFISRDPIGLLGGSNVFQYAPNPTGWIDPWGLAKTFAQRLGDFGEEQAQKMLESSGKYNSVFSVQNASNQGIDLVGARPDGKFDVFEVKTNISGNAGTLSKRQSDPVWFIKDILSNKASKGGFGISDELAKTIKANVGDTRVIDIFVKQGAKGWYVSKTLTSIWEKEKC